jgi:p-aminobenzoyl-glutamate transporter AbgT
MVQRNVKNQTNAPKYIRIKVSKVIGFILLIFIHYLQFGRHPVAGVITCYISTDYEDFTLKFR